MKFRNKNHEEEEFFEILEDDELTEEKLPSSRPVASHLLTAEEINSENAHVQKNLSDSKGASPLDSLKSRMLNANPATAAKAEQKTEQKVEEAQAENTEAKEEESLFDKCLPYVTDEKGNVAEDDSHDYKLENFGENATASDILAMLYKKYNINFDEVSDRTAKPEEETGFEDEKAVSPEPESVQTSLPVISDIDSGSTADITPEENLSQTGTIRFTPLHDESTSTDILSVSSATKAIDLTGELTQLPAKDKTTQEIELKIAKNEFEEYTPEQEYISLKESKPLIISLAKSKRNRFFCLVGSIATTLLFCLLTIPVIAEALSENYTAFMIFALSLFSINAIINLNMFKSLYKLFSKKAVADSFASLITVIVAAYSVIAFLNKINPIDTMLLGNAILCFRAIGAFMESTQLLSNLRQINTKVQKRALTLIEDPAVTYGIAKDATIGDALIAAPRYTELISDYMKQATFGSFMKGKLRTISIAALITSAVMGVLIGLYFANLTYGFYSAASIFCLAGMPLLYLIEAMPLYSAAKKLNRKGAMFAGKTGAERIEKANAVVLSSEDLFPSGTITLHDIKVLSENSIDDTLIRAAALTDAIGSPLSNIFKRIPSVGEATEVPVADTVKYEERLGISGWVDDKLLFIGNRTLLEAHGIAVPSVETDRRILKNGYFPVYVASGNRVYALLIIQYSVNPEVAHELKKLTGMGVTVLVNNTDPNLNEEMICDYLGLYNDSVKIMNAAGTHLYKTATRPAHSISAPAAYKGNPLALVYLLNCACRFRKSNTFLTVAYILIAILGIVLFIYAPFSSGGSLLTGSFVLLYSLISSLISLILYLFFKP